MTKSWIFALFLSFISQAYGSLAPFVEQSHKLYPVMMDRYEAQRNSGDNLAQSIDIKMATINLGLLYTFAVKVPSYSLRRGLLKNQLEAFIQKENPTIINFQEVWTGRDLKTIQSVATKFNFISISHLISSPIEKHGLEILIHKDLIEGAKIVVDFPQYKERLWYLGKNRGLLTAQIKLSNNKVLTIGNTHFTPVVGNNNSIRYSQTQNMLDYVNILLTQGNNKFQKTDYFLIGGDLNFSPYYDFTCTAEPNEENGLWLGNTKNYDYFNTNHFQVYDTWAVNNSNQEGYTLSVCDNDLVKLSYFAKTEPEQRIDYILAVMNAGRSFTATSSELIFNTPLLGNNRESLRTSENNQYNLYLSDHFGIISALSLQ